MIAAEGSKQDWAASCMPKNEFNLMVSMKAMQTCAMTHLSQKQAELLIRGSMLPSENERLHNLGVML